MASTRNLNQTVRDVWLGVWGGVGLLGRQYTHICPWRQCMYDLAYVYTEISEYECVYVSSGNEGRTKEAENSYIVGG